ncbi:hypothetical protein B0T18DRAFT_307442, partial [Schizothecium vesticola]
VEELLDGQNAEHASRQQESDDRSWTRTTTQQFKVERTQAFYLDLHSRDSLKTSHCVVCKEMKPPVDIKREVWQALIPRESQLWAQIQHFHLLDSLICSPQHQGATADICSSCIRDLQKQKVPFICRGNNLGMRCTHTQPKELSDLTPVEERLISISQSFGLLIKLEINENRTTNGNYRKLRKGHITVFPNNIEDLTTNIHPHPITHTMSRIGICFLGPRQPLPKDVAFMLAVRPQKVRQALTWLKRNNPLYKDVEISNSNLRTYDDVVSHDIPS